MRDYYGNYVDVDYPDATTWEIKDSHGRTQTVTFAATSTPYTRITSLQLTRFGGGVATYSFQYSTATIDRQRFNETLEVLYKAWTEYDSFTYDGQEVKIPNETTVWPKPLQKPHPPMWVAGTSVETMELAAAWDMMPITTGLLGEGGVKAHLASFVKAKKAIGKPYKNVDLGIQSMTCVTATDDEAESLLQYPRWQMRAGRALGTAKVTNGQVSPGPTVRGVSTPARPTSRETRRRSRPWSCSTRSRRARAWC